MRPPRDSTGAEVRLGSLMVVKGDVKRVVAMTIRDSGWYLTFSDHTTARSERCVRAGSEMAAIAEAARIGYEAGVAGARVIDLSGIVGR